MVECAYCQHPKDRVAKHVVPKVMEPIMVITLNPFHYIDYNVSLKNFTILLCIYKHTGVNKVWRCHIGMGKMHNAFLLVFPVLGTNQRFFGVKEMIFLNKKICNERNDIALRECTIH